MQNMIKHHLSKKYITWWFCCLIKTEEMTKFYKHNDPNLLSSFIKLSKKKHYTTYTITLSQAHFFLFTRTKAVLNQLRTSHQKNDLWNLSICQYKFEFALIVIIRGLIKIELLKKHCDFYLTKSKTNCEPVWNWLESTTEEEYRDNPAL